MTLAAVLFLSAMQPAYAAGNLTLPFNIPNPTITSWTDHHYPNRQADGVMVRFDGATGYAYDGHRGTDFAVPANTPVVAADDGTVIYAEWSNDGGWGVVIDHATDRTAYFHNNVLFVYPGQHVSHGQLIALSGSTGNSTGPHVHFEVRDLQTAWHSIDPFGWTGKGQDPWPFDVGYLWSSNPPMPFLLPLAFFSGARWDYWYGADGPPPPLHWQLRDGQHGLAGYAVQWDQDPGANAPRTQATSGTAAIPGTGAHTLHLRVWDRAGHSADITYLYLYDVDPPTAALSSKATTSRAVDLHWSGADALAGVKDATIEVREGSGEFRPWLAQSIAQPAAGPSEAAMRFLGEAGESYEFRLTVRDAARNAAPQAMAGATIPQNAGPPTSAADQAILGSLPDQPDGAGTSGGLMQEHPLANGALVLERNGAMVGVGGNRLAPTPSPGSSAPAVDLATTNSGSVVLLADGTTWNGDGTPGSRIPVSNPVRLLVSTDGTLVTVGAGGAVSFGDRAQKGVAIASGLSVVDAALFPGHLGGLMLDTAGTLHPFGGADVADGTLPSSWTLPVQPAGIALAGTLDAPAGILTDSNGDWQTFGSLLLLPTTMFAGPAFDRTLGLPLR